MAAGVGMPAGLDAEGVRMNAETLTALRGSIAKWRAIVAGTGINRGPSDCPLCKLFFFVRRCVGCPVFERTGETGCGGTPYSDYEKNGELEVAKAELDFLISLLPEGESA